jgi:hypothetical protein
MPAPVQRGDDSEPKKATSATVIDVAIAELVGEHDEPWRPAALQSRCDEAVQIYHHRIAGPIAIASLAAAAGAITWRKSRRAVAS